MDDVRSDEPCPGCSGIPQLDHDGFCFLCGKKYALKDRPEWDEVWMNIAYELARRSINPHAKVGCVIVTSDNTQILSLGFNGDWKGGPNEIESDEPGKSGTVHAEANALIKCDFNDTRRKIMYVTQSPCVNCARLIINGNIDEVVFDDEYRDPAGLELLKHAGIPVRQLD